MKLNRENKKPSANLDAKHGAILLGIARKSLEETFNSSGRYRPKKELIPGALLKHGASFVTLTKNGDLRGCIGSLQAVRPLYEDVIENACNAAFYDTRFPSVEQNELEKIKIEVSVLSAPEKLEYGDPDDLVSYLEKHKPGLVIHYGYRSATFLPQVWEELATAEDFLSHLCLKAGLDADFWKSGRLEAQVYSVQKFKD